MAIITKTNFKNVLRALDFIESGDIFEKKFEAFNCSLSVNFATERLIYPEEIKGRDRNDDFEQPENFVVFECVNRLLEKGYRPEHIELEKEWHLGHDAKGGRADVCVSAPDGSMLFIVECKTAGREFDKAYRDTCMDGGQLFSYWQQERSTKWLVLYASGIDGDAISYKAPTINCTDDPNIVIGAKKDNTIKLYTSAFTAEGKHLVWRDTYASTWYDDLVFSSDSTAYKVGIKPLRKKDLRDFTPDDKIVNKFEEILRHNNVSDKENAFNRLVALFICKLVDEIQKSDTDEVEFQYKQGTDTYETLQDRLQRLHKEGMETFMREEIFYVSADYPEWLFSNYTGHQRKKAIEDLKDKIRILKFFSNNDFSFKDVHNEELFYQNGKILVEVVQLFEKYRIVYPSKHQFLGDLFEQLLNKGFKQNEGQFFTPMPITRFIWDCLPVEQITHSEKGTIYPKIIDYACGAGHFLTEAVEAINAFVESDGDNAWVRDHIFGIEKDYRLARVAKISLYMNGAGEGNIVFGDGLENLPERQIENGTFDILVANPPYAVKDFKQHLKIKNNSFELLERIGDNGSEIETLFVERIAQLLKPKGIAAVVLPSSILSNDSSSYTGAREHILQNFLIRAIVQFGSKTFGATGTNTVVLFLEKYNEPPKHKDMVHDSVMAILSGAELEDWQDQEIFESYIAKIDVGEESYAAFAKQILTFEDIAEIEYFKMYLDAFESDATITKYKSTQSFKKLSAEDQIKQLTNKFYQYAKALEFEKLFYFALTYTQQTVIITAPADNAKQKEFLGYDWSNRKGNEGIQILSPGGKMYCDHDRNASDTLAHIVRASYSEKTPSISADIKSYITIVQTCDMLNLQRPTINVALKTAVVSYRAIESKYPMVSIGNKEMFNVTIGKRVLKTEFVDNGDIPVFSANVREPFGFIDKLLITNFDVASVLWGIDGDWMVRYMPENKAFYPTDHCGVVRVKTSDVLPYYLAVALEVVGQSHKFSRSYRASIDRIEEVSIPMPPVTVQQQLIEKCMKIDNEYSTSRMTNEEYRERIEALFDELEIIIKGKKGD